jgi:hypothetical protein
MLIACLSITACGRQKLTQIPQPPQDGIGPAYVKSLEEKVEFYEWWGNIHRSIIFIMSVVLGVAVYGRYCARNYKRQSALYQKALVGYSNAAMRLHRTIVGGWANETYTSEKNSQEYLDTAKFVVKALQEVDNKDWRSNLNSMLNDVRAFSQKDDLLTEESRIQIQGFINESRITLNQPWYVRSLTFFMDTLRWTAQRKKHKLR